MHKYIHKEFCSQFERFDTIENIGIFKITDDRRYKHVARFVFKENQIPVDQWTISAKRGDLAYLECKWIINHKCNSYKLSSTET